MNILQLYYTTIGLDWVFVLLEDIQYYLVILNSVSTDQVVTLHIAKIIFSFLNSNSF